MSVQAYGAPAHIAIIMDGNGRWAKKRLMPRNFGHREGAETLKRITRYCRRIGVRYLTVYALSTENWKRPRDEVIGIVNLLKHYIGTFDNDPERDLIRVRFIGDISALSVDVQKSFAQISKKTKDNKNAITLTIAFNYGGRDEIVRAARKAASMAKKGEINEGDIDEGFFASLLDTAGIPDPDLLIRSGAELRVSNFLLWQITYSELYFTQTLWPDFGEADIDEAVDSYNTRRRRFGAGGGYIKSASCDLRSNDES